MRYLVSIIALSFVIIISGCVNYEMPESSVYLPTQSEIESLGYTVIDIAETLDYEPDSISHLSSSTRVFNTNYNGLGFYKTESINVATMLFDSDESAIVEFNRINDAILSVSNQDDNRSVIDEPTLFDNSIFVYDINLNRYEGNFRKDKVVFTVFINANSSADAIKDIANIIGDKIE